MPCRRLYMQPCTCRFGVHATPTRKRQASNVACTIAGFSHISSHIITSSNTITTKIYIKTFPCKIRSPTAAAFVRICPDVQQRAKSATCTLRSTDQDRSSFLPVARHVTVTVTTARRARARAEKAFVRFPEIRCRQAGSHHHFTSPWRQCWHTVYM